MIPKSSIRVTHAFHWSGSGYGSLLVIKNAIHPSVSPETCHHRRHCTAPASYQNTKLGKLRCVTNVLQLAADYMIAWITHPYSLATSNFLSRESINQSITFYLRRPCQSTLSLSVILNIKISPASLRPRANAHLIDIQDQ